MIRVCLFLSLFCILISCQDQEKNHGPGPGEQNGGSEDVLLSEAFDVSGAQAMALTSNEVNSNSSGNNQNENDILKILADGNYQSIFKKIHPSWKLKIVVLELGPDGSLYIGLDWGVWIYDDSAYPQARNMPNFHNILPGKNVALFKITPQGKTSIVDPDIQGMGQFYGNELWNKKQVQFDQNGNIFYLGRQGQTTVLKKKSPDGKITPIGNSRMEVRDFIVAPNGMVLFHGANRGDWNTQWLRVFYQDGSVANVYYREGSGYLKTYFLDHDSNLIIVGENLELDGSEQLYNGIMRVQIEDSHQLSYESLFDDSDEFQLPHDLRFSWAHHLFIGHDKSVYALFSTYDWSQFNGKREYLFKILDPEGEVDINEFPLHPDFLSMKLGKIIGNYFVYLTSNHGFGSVIRVDLHDSDPLPPTDITGTKGNVEIYNFIYHPLKKQLLYDVYNLEKNSNYIVAQDIESSLVVEENDLSNFNVADLLPFVAL